MTLIIGIRCTDGVVVGADGAMTFGYDSMNATIMQTYRQKINTINHKHIKALVAGSGEIGLAQRFDNIVSNHTWNSGSIKKPTIETGTVICNLAIKDFAKTQQNYEQGYGFCALMAMLHVKGSDTSFELIEFYLRNLRPEVKLGDNWYVSIGSGKNIAESVTRINAKNFIGKTNNPICKMVYL